MAIEVISELRVEILAKKVCCAKSVGYRNVRDKVTLTAACSGRCLQCWSRLGYTFLRGTEIVHKAVEVHICLHIDAFSQSCHDPVDTLLELNPSEELLVKWSSCNDTFMSQYSYLGSGNELELCDVHSSLVPCCAI